MPKNISTIKDLIKPYVEKSNRYPALCHVYAMLADNIVRKESLGDMDITFTKNGFLARIGNEWINHTNKIDSNAANYEVVVSDEESVEGEYINTKIKYTNSINACYTNRFINNENIWLYFLNKYLRLYNQNVSLKSGSTGGRFLSLEAKKSSVICKNNAIKISIIMCAYNSQGTILTAINSILSQTHTNIELIIVNDKSTDATAEIVDKAAKLDPRVKAIHSTKNAGAYISRNIALNNVTGDYFTCHDADDIALPTRIENQLKIILEEGSTSSICLMLRISSEGEITRKTRPTSNSPDGYAKLCHISGMHNTKLFRENFGYWDSVRVGGDSELLNRIRKSKNYKISVTPQVEYLALDDENGATRDVNVGLFSEKGVNVRERYKNSWLEWHEKSSDTYLDFPQQKRKFDAPSEILN